MYWFPCERVLIYHVASLLSMRIEGIKAFLKPIQRCSVDVRKRYESDKCGRKSF